MKAILTSLKLALPAASVLLLAGCITDPYQYRGGYGGDYYYGQPSVDYRHRGYYGPYGHGYGYGYPYHGRSGWSFGLSYGYPYWYGRHGYGRYGHGYGGWPYHGWYGWPSHPPVVVRPRPDTDPEPGGDNDRGPAPWRDIDRLRNRGPGVRMPIEPAAPRVSRQPQLDPEPTRMRTPRPVVEAPRAIRSSRIERVQRMAEDRDDER